AEGGGGGSRLHGRVEGGDACAPGGDLPAHAGVGGAPRPAPAAPQPRPPRLPVDGTALTLVRRRPGRTEVPPPAPVTTRDHGGRRHLGVGGELRPLHVAVRVRDGEPVLAS